MSYTVSTLTGDREMTYHEAITRYNAGLISYTELCKAIDFINMGSDSCFYDYPQRKNW